MNITIIDNYDSFTYNLSHLIKELGATVTVLRNDRFKLDELEACDRILLSPGPGIPEEAGLLMEVIRHYAGKKPILGVCLGEQAIGEVFGGRLAHLSQVYHGVQSRISIVADDPLFKGLPHETEVGRYHSWTVDTEGLPECLEMAKKHDITVLRSHETTSYIVSSLISALKSYLAPRITRHGVLVEIYGEGILIFGDSGIGKSEAAVELVKRGHRLVADDAVELKRISSNELIGGAPDVLRHYIELRGIGVINVAKLFGMGAVKDSASIDLIINIVPWQDGEIYDRLGLESQYTDILGVKIPSITVPVTPGRNLAVIFEVAAMNNRQKRMGYNAAVEFTEQLSKFFQQNAEAPKF